MRERNKSIFRILFIISGGILLMQTILLATLMPARTEERILAALALLFSTALSGGLMAYFSLHPQYNYQYKLQWDKEERRLHWRRVTYAPDPHGLRFISSSISVFMLTLMTASISATLIWDVPDAVYTSLIVFCCLGMAAAFCIVEYLLNRQESQQ